MEKKIGAILVNEVGWIYTHNQVKREDKQLYETTWVNVENPIEKVHVNSVIWYRQGKTDYQGKHVIAVTYE